MYRLTVLLAPDTEEMRKLGEAVAGVFKRREIEATVKPAVKSGIPDILASDILIFGLNGRETKPAETDFEEMFRAFSGINLAGKFAGLLSFDGNGSPAVFRKALKDTGIDIYEEPLDVSLRAVKRSRLRSWTGKLYHWFKDLAVESFL